MKVLLSLLILTTLVDQCVLVAAAKQGTRGRRASTKMMMGGTLEDFLNDMVSFGTIQQSQMDALMEFVDIKTEHVESIRHNGNTETAFQKEVLRAYISAEHAAGSLSEETASYLSSLLSLDEPLADTVRVVPAAATYTSNGNVALLGRISPEADVTYNGIWGVSLGSREYALQCNGSGLHIIDVTDPTSPFRVQLIPMDGGRIWRDANVHTDDNNDTYAYVAAQGGLNPSLIIIKLSALSMNTAHGEDSNPIPPEDIANRGFTDLGHTLNVQNGLLFINSARPLSGCRILDLQENPFDPPELTSWSGSFRDCHDSFQRNDVMVGDTPRDILFSADGNSERFRIIDITNIRSVGTEPRLLGTTEANNGYAHSIAMSDDTKTMYTFEEDNIYDIGVYDIGSVSLDRESPQINSFTWSGDTTQGSSIVHNGHVRGNYLLVAYYEAGFRVFDISNPLNPLEVGKYETWRDPDGDGTFQRIIEGRFNGAWNLHPFLPSGNVLVSDTTSGLFIFRVDPVPLPETPSNLRASRTTSMIVTLSWDDAPGASGYTIKRGSTSGTYTILATNVIGSSYRDTFVPVGNLIYVVQATNAEGASPESSVAIDGCGNGVCEFGENCTSCPQDCLSGNDRFASCGNGICESGDGESCVTCPSDCSGVQDGFFSFKRYCCGNGDGINPVGCNDSRCGGNCEVESVQGDAWCCGDGSCTAPLEFCGNCLIDCTISTEELSCTGGVDENCDGFIDCKDPGCFSSSVCASPATPKAAPAIVCSDYASDRNACQSQPSCRYAVVFRACVRRIFQWF